MVERGGKKQNIELGFTEPWLFDHPISIGADIYYLTRIREYWDEKRRGGSLRLGVPFPLLDYTRVYWRYSLGDLGIFDIEEGYLSEWGEELEEGFKRTSATKLSFVRDSRDNIFSATTGSMNHYSVEFAGGLLGGEVDFHKHILETRWYSSSFWKFVLMGRIRAGFVGGYTTPRSVPVYEKFFLGGIGEDGLRGYPDRSIGPEVNGRNVGGRTMLLMGLEYKFPLAENIHALLFFDAGNAWESAEKSRMSDLYKGVGFGIRIDVPMLGMIGFDFGYGIDRKRWEPHFQLGVPF
jgi:outer membrane protein insertion porin family